MNFSEFLRSAQQNKKIATVKDYYQFLGGEKILSITLRHFQQIASGSRPPTEKLLATIFKKTPPGERKTIITSFFQSVLHDSKDRDVLMEYLEQYLSPAVEQESKSVWDTARTQMMMSEEQLEFLIKNAAALRLHQRVTMHEKHPVSQSGLTPQQLKEMQNLQLIRIEGGLIKPARELFRIPTYENSTPKMTAKGTDLILKFLDLYVSKEGGPNQHVTLQMQLVTPAMAEKIFEQLRAFKKWIQSLATDEKRSGPGVVPFLFMSFGKKLEPRDL